MPSAKPSALQTRHSTKDEKATRTESESAMTPVTSLRSLPPESLRGRKTASKVWKRIVSLYFEVSGQIVTAFDEDLLAKYCLLEEECLNMEGLRDAVLKDYATVHNKLLKLNPKGDQLKIYYKTLEQANALLERYKGLDARLDGKRKLLHTLSQSLYLTPRSRTGVAPTPKEKPKADPLEKFD